LAELFNNKPGIIMALTADDKEDNPFRMVIEDFPENGAEQGVIITELAVQRHGNFQFMHTLKDLIYVYSFGERIGQMYRTECSESAELKTRWLIVHKSDRSDWSHPGKL
jgi:hypothetical protein